MCAIRAFAFGDLDDGLWGAAWSAFAGEPLPVAVGGGSAGEVLAATLTGGGEGEEWRVEGERIELVVSPSAQATGHGGTLAQPTGRPDGLEGFDQLCRVRGRVTPGGADVEVDALG